MDYDHILKLPVENLPPTMFGNNFSWTTPFHPESIYTNGSRPSSFINPPYCSTKDYSKFSNLSPETYSSSDARYYPYRPMFSPFKGADKSCHFYTDYNGFYGPKTAENCFAAQNCLPPNVEMPSKMINGMYDEKTHYFRSNQRDKRQKSYKFENAGKVSTQKKVCPNIESNYDPDFVRNYVPHENVNTSNEYENKFPATIGENDSHEEMIEAENIAKLATNNSSTTDDKNFMAQDTGLTLKSLADPLVSHFDNALEDNTNLIFTDETTTNTDENNFKSVDELGFLDCPLMNIPVAENVNCDAQNVKRENLPNSGMESFKPIFIGKDGNGQDVFLLVESGLEVSGVKSEIDWSVDDTNLEVQNQQTGTHESVENVAWMIDTSSDFPFIEPINTVSHEPVANVIYSHVDSYAAEEVVVTSEDPKTETEKDENLMNVDKNDAENLKHILEKICGISDFAPEASTSSWNSVMSTDNLAEEERCTMGGFMPKSGTSKENRNTDDTTIRDKIPPGEKIDFQDEERALKRCFQFDCNESLSNIQHAYAAYFTKRVKHEYEQLSNNEQFWKMYRTIVHEVGSNVMQTMYNVLPRLIEISNDAKAVPNKQSKSTKKCNKKRLKVKIPANTKK